MANAREAKYSENDITTAKRQLEERGWAVIDGVIPEETCDEYSAALHKWYNKLSPDTYPQHIQSIIHKYGIAHHEVAWKVRLAAKDVFAKIWGTEKLLSSTDGVAIGRPAETSKSGFYKDRKLTDLALHHDQSPKRVGLHALQGAVYLKEALQDDWCFCVMDNSHKLHKEFFELFPPNPNGEHRKCSAEEVQWFLDRDCPIIRIPMSPGSIVLWDSRTVHAGAKAKRGRANAERWRYVVFTCQSPATWADERDLAIKKEAYYKLKCSRHWPADGCSNFLNNDPPSPFDILELPDIARTEEVQRLAGVLAYDFEDGTPNGPEKPETNTP